MPASSTSGGTGGGGIGERDIPCMSLEHGLLSIKIGRCWGDVAKRERQLFSKCLIVSSDKRV